MSKKENTAAAAEKPAVTAESVAALRAQKEALERELTQLGHDTSEQIVARIVKRFHAHETATLQKQLDGVAKDLAAGEAVLAKQKPAPAPATTSPLPGL